MSDFLIFVATMACYAAALLFLRKFDRRPWE